MFHDVPIKHGDFPVRYVNVGQRVSDGNQKNDGSFFGNVMLGTGFGWVIHGYTSHAN